MVQIGSKKYGMMFKFFNFSLFFVAKCGYIFLWIRLTFCYITKLIRKNCSKKMKKMKILMLITNNWWTLCFCSSFSQEMLSHDFNLGAWLMLDMDNKVYFSNWKEIECFPNASEWTRDQNLECAKECKLNTFPHQVQVCGNQRETFP